MAVYIPQVIDSLDSTSSKDGLSANQGRILNTLKGDLEELKTIDKNNLVFAINEIKEDVNYLITQINDINGEEI